MELTKNYIKPNLSKMKNLIYASGLAVLLQFIYIAPSQGQLPFDEIMMSNGEVCAALMFEHGTWNRYWEGSFLRENANIGTLTRQLIMPYVAVGIGNHVNFMASIPYVRTEASGGTQAGQEGIQDLSLSLKVKWLEKRAGGGNFSFLTNTNFNTPVGPYLSDYMPFSIGAGAPEVGMRGIVSYRTDFGLVARTSMAYLWRGQTQIERDYYYENGSVYSSFMNVPNAVNFHAALAYWLLDDQLSIEATFQSLNCLTGDDIRSYNRPQPTNKMDFAQVGTWIQYYIKGRQGLGTIAYVNHTVSGRNMGKFTTVGLGLTYQFQAFNKSSN
ncbi:translation initiation factor IF-2 [Indibacter alkaliphilus LW1]|uniref:Translation initiation factor IF-2 n=2 Tax=Indibacter TaxID=647744 RepID=S2D4Y5_INDAL|nr:translation initiation factor IF-2 [Indibacter alkaliphilus LW1]